MLPCCANILRTKLPKQTHLALCKQMLLLMVTIVADAVLSRSTVMQQPRKNLMLLLEILKEIAQTFLSDKAKNQKVNRKAKQSHSKRATASNHHPTMQLDSKTN